MNFLPFSTEDEPIAWIWWVAWASSHSMQRSWRNQDEIRPVPMMPHRRVGFDSDMMFRVKI